MIRVSGFKKLLHIVDSFVIINTEVSCHLSALLGHMCSEREILQLRLTRVVGNFPLLHDAAEMTSSRQSLAGVLLYILS